MVGKLSFLELISSENSVPQKRLILLAELARCFLFQVREFLQMKAQIVPFSEFSKILPTLQIQPLQIPQTHQPKHIHLSQSDNTYQTVLNYAQQLQFITNVISQTQEGVANFPAALDRQASLTILDAFSYVTPIVNGSQSNATSSTINITLNLTNINGYLYCGLGYPNVTIPNITQLRTGIDGNGVALIYRFFDQVNTGGILNFTFLNLYSSKAYRVFFAGSNLDTSINAVASNVSYVDVMTSVDNAKNGANESWKLNNLKSLLKFIVLILIISLF